MKEYKVGLVLTADGKLLKAEVRESKDALEDLGKGAKRAEKPIRDTGDALGKTGREAKGAARDFDKAKASTRSLAQSAGGLNGALRLIGISSVTAGIGRFVTSGIALEASFERLENRVNFFTGAQAATNRELAFARQAADDLVTSERGLIQARAGLLPLEQAGLLTRQKSIGITTGLIDASKTLGAEQAQISQVMFGMGQALSSSTVRAEEFNQVVEPLPGLAQAMDRAIAEMTDNGERNFRKMINAGEVTNDLFSSVLVRALQEFEGASANTADSVDGHNQQLKTSWERFQRALVDTSFYKTATNQLKGFLDNLTAEIEGVEISPVVRVAQIDEQMKSGTRTRTNLRTGIETVEKLSRVERERLAVERASLISMSLDIEEQAATAEAAIEASAKAVQEQQVKLQNAALDRLDNAPRSIEQKAEKIRGFIATIRKDVADGLTEAEAAAPAIAAYQLQLDALFKKTVAPASPDPVADFRKRSAESLNDALRGQGAASLTTDIAERGRAALQEYARSLEGALDIDLSGLVSFRNVDAATAAVSTFRDEIYRASDALDGSVKMGADGLPADPALRAEILANARSMATMTGQAEAYDRQAAAIADTERDRARAAEEVAADHKRATKSIADGLADLGSPYDQAIAKAQAWREEALGGLDPEAEGFDTFRSDAERVYTEQVAAAREEQAEREKAAIGTIASALTSLEGPYVQAATAADKWREETRAALVKAGVDVDAHAARIEEVYAGRIAAAEEERVERTRAMVAGIDRAMDALGSPYEKAVADADRWRERTLATYAKAETAIEGYADKVETVYESRIAAAGQAQADRQERAVATLTAALDALGTPYEKATAAAAKWRENANASLAKAGVDLEAHAATVEAVYSGRIAAAEQARADRQEKAVATLTAALDALGTPYEKATAAAAKWRDDTNASLIKAGVDAEAYAATVETVYSGRIAAAEKAQADRQKEAVATLTAALDALGTPYERAAKAAAKWRESTNASLVKAGVDLEAHAATVEAVYSGRIAAAEKAQADRQAKAVAGVTAALEALGTPYQKAVAAANKWRADTNTALTEAGVDLALHAATVERVVQGKITAAHEAAAERQRRAIETVTDALRSADPTYARSGREIETWAADTRKALADAGVSADAYADTIDEITGLRLAKAYEDDLNRRTDWSAGIERTLADMAGETEDFASASSDALKGFAKTGEDAFVALSTGGKLAMGDLVDTVIADLARLAYQQTIGKSVNSIGGQLLGGLGSILGGGGLGSFFGAGAAPAPVATIGPTGTGVFHSGGIIGGTPPGSRTLSPSRAAIAAAPRFHTGGVIGSDERLIVGKVGEPVFTPRQFDNMNGTISALSAMAARPIVVEGGGGGNVSINVAPELEVKENRKPNGDTTIDISRQLTEQMSAEIASGRGLAPAIQSRFGLNQSFNGRR